MRDKNRYRRNHVAVRNIRDRVIAENPLWNFGDCLDLEDWEEWVDELTRGREKGFHSGHTHAPSSHRRGINREFLAKNKHVMRNLDHSDDPLFRVHIKDMDWDYF